MRSNTKAGCLKTSSSGQSSWVTLYSLRIKRLQNDYLKVLYFQFPDEAITMNNYFEKMNSKSGWMGGLTWH
jgi:hypothetical protein